MIAQADAEAGTHPIEESGDREVPPAEHEEGGQGPNVKDDQRDRGNPIHALVLGHVNDVCAQLISRKTWLGLTRTKVHGAGREWPISTPLILEATSDFTSGV